MSEYDENHCFRCKGLAVVNKKSLENLPSVLNRAANLIDLRDTDDQYEAFNVMTALREYAIMIEAMPDD